MLIARESDLTQFRRRVWSWKAIQTLDSLFTEHWLHWHVS